MEIKSHILTSMGGVILVDNVDFVGYVSTHVVDFLVMIMIYDDDHYDIIIIQDMNVKELKPSSFDVSSIFKCQPCYHHYIVKNG